MGDYWKPGEGISASKLNRNSASTNAVNYSGGGSFSKNGSTFASAVPDIGPECFVVAVDEVHREEIDSKVGGTPTRYIYSHSWTAVTFDTLRGLWKRDNTRRGHFSVDPLYMVTPNEQLTPSGDGKQYGDSKEFFLTSVYSVQRDPHTGILFFFS